MVVKVTLILSNDTELRVRDAADKAMAEQIMQKQYQEGFNRIARPNEKFIVEQCELIKEV